ncbi:MAG: DNA replication/repair protein RecF [Myxococcota bacterium]|jgi:DNA replication and repair protein RecF|nr:DNA replication/repair protein RecF [Myxococcota bacterium]
MYIERLQLKNFRNIESINTAVEKSWVVISGNNAQGKTNLLEALYIASTGQSFRKSLLSDFIKDNHENSIIRCQIIKQNVRHQIDVQLQKTKRSIRVDDKPLRSLTKLLSLMNIVAFFPDDLMLVKGSPEGRRKFIDRCALSFYPDSADIFKAFRRSLKERNSILRKYQRQEQKLDVQLLKAFDEQLIKYGAKVHQYRKDALDELKKYVEHYLLEFNVIKDSLEISLEPGVPIHDINSFQSSYRRALAESMQIDQIRGLTTVGPQRSDLLFNLDGKEAKSFASQGQQRSLVLALKLAELKVIEEKVGCAPLLILDDVSSELDQTRTEYLFKAIEDLGCQVWISTTGSVDLKIPKENHHFNITNGALKEL